MVERRRFIVEADGGSRGNPGPAAYGAVVREFASGEVLAERGEEIERATNNVAEYNGLIAGLSLAQELDPRAMLEVRMDSKLVIEQCAGRWRVRHPELQPLHQQAKDLAPADTIWTWVPRADNAAADALLNRALDGEPTFFLATSATGDTSATGATGDTAAHRADPEYAEDRGGDSNADPANRLVGWDDKVGVPTRLVLLRHGETVHTAQKRFSGAGGLDPPLTETGRAQAVNAAELLSDRGDIEVVVASPLRRTQQTAQIVADRLGAEVAVVEGLAEAAYGAWEGYSFTEVGERWPEELQKWLDSSAEAPPGGESLDSVEARVRAALEGMLAAYSGRTVLAVTHVTPIKALVRHALEAPPHVLFRMELAPASLTEIHWYPDGTGSLRSFSVATHLPDPAGTDGR